MSSIIRAQPFEDIRNMRLHRFLPDGKLGGDLLIRVSVRDQPEDIDLAWRQVALASVLG